MAANKQLSTTNYMLIAGLVCLVVIIVAGVAGKSLISTMILNQKVIDHKSKALNTLNSNLTNAETLKSAVSQLGARQTILDNAMPTKNDFSGLSSMAGQVAAISGVKFKGMTDQTTSATGTTSTVDASGANTFDFNLSVDGNYTSLLAFLHNLELSARPLQVLGVVYTGTNNALNATYTIRSYTTDPVTITPKTEVIK